MQNWLIENLTTLDPAALTNSQLESITTSLVTLLMVAVILVFK